MRPLHLLGIVGFVAAVFLLVRVGSESAKSAPASEPARVALAVPEPQHAQNEEPTVQRTPVIAQTISAAWHGADEPVFAKFREWTERYLAAPIGDRAGLVAEGRSLAAARRTALREVIRRDPRTALELAVPMLVRQQLPSAILTELEERISGGGELALLAVTPAPGQVVTEPIFRTALIEGREFRAFVYGRRDRMESIPRTTMVGIAIEGDFAVAESPLRVLEAGELAAGRPIEALCVEGDTTAPVASAPEAPLNLGSATAVELAGQICVLCNPEEAAKLNAHLIDSEGTRLNAADNQPGTSGISNRPQQSWTHGTKKLLVIVVDFADFPGRPAYPFSGAALTDDYIVNLINGSNGVADFYARSSFGKTAVQIAATASGDSADVTDVLRMPRTARYYATGSDPSVAPYTAKNSELHADARALATAAGYDLATYNLIGVVFRNLGPANVSNSQITYGGLGNITGSNFWVNGYWDFRVVGHEIGHNYGLSHSNLWKVTDGNPISPAGSSFEYGDELDLMGGGDTPEFDFSHWNKSLLRWIPDTAVTTIENSGTYRVSRFDDSAANLSSSRALKIVRDSQRDYWIGYRRATSLAAVDNGAYVLWGYNTSRQGDLLDLTTPGTNVLDATLPLNQSFTDSTYGITIRPIAQGGAGAEEYLDVQVTLTAQVNFTAASAVVGEGEGSVSFTVTRARDSSGAITVNYATASGTASSGADFTATSGTLSWAAGDMSSRTITVPIVADAEAETTETFTLALSSPSGAVLGGNSMATVTVFDPGVRDTSFAATFINSSVEKVLPLPDGSIVIGGWFSSVRDSANSDHARAGVTRVDATGKVDSSFAAGGGATGTPVYDLALQPDGKIVVVGAFTAINGVARNRVARLNADGSLDLSFDPGTGADGTVHAALLQSDGKIVIGGSFTSINGTPREYLARLNSNGSLDTGFVGPDFGATSTWSVESLAMQADGKLLVGGSFYLAGSYFKAGLCRVNTNGAIDMSFDGVVQGAHAIGSTNSLRTVRAIVVQPDGKILIGGSFTAFNATARTGVARLTTTGALDPTFAPTLNGDADAILLMPDGRILLGGSFTSVDGTTVSRLALLSSSGTLDSSFAAAGSFSAGLNDFAWLPSGRIVSGGDFGSFQGSTSQRPLWQFAGPVSGPPGVIQLASSTGSGAEGGSVQLSVTRSGSGIGAVTMGYATIPGSASGSDFTATAGVLTWANGDLAAKTITVPLAADAISDAGETLVLQLGQPAVGGGVILGATQRATVTISESSGYSLFNSTHFSGQELENTNLSGPTADPDSDGFTNLVEYALGMNPRAASSAGLPAVSVSGGFWEFTFSRPVGRTDIAYAVEFSTTLGSWSTVAHESVSTANGVETLRARVSTAGASTAFFRLRITR